MKKKRHWASKKKKTEESPIWEERVLENRRDVRRRMPILPEKRH